MRKQLFLGWLGGIAIGILLLVIFLADRSNPAIPGSSLDRSEATITRGILPVTGVPKPEEVTVTRVIDGDTLVLADGESVRLIGIDAPESKESGFSESRAKLVVLVEGKKVRFEKDVSERDRYGRLLYYIWADNVFVNLEMIRSGFARAYRYEPDIKYAEFFSEAEKQARAAGLGLWGFQASAPLPKGEYTCSQNTYNCSDFKDHATAQAVFEQCGGTASDIHKLDADGDGSACESLP